MAPSSTVCRATKSRSSTQRPSASEQESLLKPFRKIRTDDRDLDSVQSNIANVLTPISKVLLLDGTRLKDVVLAIGSNRIEHNLKRPIEGWFITRKNAAADVYETDATSLTLSLTSSAAVTVDIWVY